MKSIFVDTNIIIDLIADRRPFSKFAIQIFSKAEKGEIKLYTSTHSIVTTHHILKGYITDQELRLILLNLADFLSVIPINISIVSKALKSKEKDFEDIIQLQCAQSLSEIDCIVTRNVRDFKSAEIPVFSSDELVKILN